MQTLTLNYPGDSANRDAFKEKLESQLTARQDAVEATETETVFLVSVETKIKRRHLPEASGIIFGAAISLALWMGVFLAARLIF